MNKVEYLILSLAEEASEVAQAACKMGRFGPDDSPPSGKLPNNEYLVAEINDMLGVLSMLQDEGIVLVGIGHDTAIQAKRDKIKKYMDYAIARGTLSA